MTSNLGVTRTGHIVHLDDNGNRDFSPSTQRIVQMVLVAFLAVVAALAVVSVVAPAPWSPLGIAQETSTVEREEAPAPEAPSFDIPDGWGPAAPVAPAEPDSAAI